MSGRKRDQAGFRLLRSKGLGAEVAACASGLRKLKMKSAVISAIMHPAGTCIMWLRAGCFFAMI